MTLFELRRWKETFFSVGEGWLELKVQERRVFLFFVMNLDGNPVFKNV